MAEHKKNFLQIPWVQSLIAIVVIFGALASFLFWQSSTTSVKIDDSYLEAPMVNIAPSTPGSLNTLYVKEGDRIDANAPIGVVGSETLYAKESGIILDAPRALGSYYAPGQKVLSIIVDTKMRVVGTIDETKGLSKLSAGQHARFTVDAYPGKDYEGVVDEVSDASNDAGIAFSISDKRAVKKFNVYVRFDASKYPELKSGMSARIWVDVK